MHYMTIILFSIFSTLFAQNVNPATGWTYDQSTTQAFYILEDLHIDGVSAEGDGTAPPAAQSGDCYNNPGTCDVIGAFIDRGDGELCVGWAYGGILNGGMTIPLMGNDGYVSAFLNNGESAYLKVYDASNSSILGITPSEELPGWSNNGILTISGISIANNTFGCTDSNACNYDSDATANDGSCWSANIGCACEDGQGSDIDCNGECNGTAWVSDCGCVDEDNSGDDCDDCAGTPNGTATEDGCGVCDTDDSNDDATCTGCTNSDADNYSGPSYIFDDGNCSFTVPAATNLSAEGGPARVYLSWDAPADSFSSNAGYTYEINLVGEGLVKSTTQTSTQITGLDGGSEYCFTVLAIHNSYGLSDSDSNESCATPQEVVGPTWRLQLVATIDSYDQFKFSGEESWLLTDDQNFIGAAADGSWGYDPLHDAPEPPNGPGNYIKLFFDHPEWNEWVTHFTEDIVLDDDDFFSTNLTRWDGRVQSDVPGSTTIKLHVETGQVPGNYEMYFELDGNYTRIEHGGETTIEFYMDGSGQKDFSVIIGNIPPQSPDNLTSVGLYNSIELDWDEDGADLNDIGNRYPATSYNVYRDDEPADPNSNNGSNDSNGPGGCGGLLTGALGQGHTDYNDDESIYADYPNEGLLQESTYAYTVTGSNSAGESSEGHTVRTSGGFDTWFDGRDSRTEATTGINADPVSAPVYEMSPNGTNGCYQTLDGCDDGFWEWTSGIYEIPHNYSPDANKIGIRIGAWGSTDDDFPYSFSENPYDFHYHWTPKSDISDVTNIVGTDTPELSFAVDNHHDNSHNPDGGSKFYTWTLETITDHPVKRSGECGVWEYEKSSNSNSADISIEIRPEPNADPIAASAEYLKRSGDGQSVITSNDYDGPPTGGDNDFNDYDGPEGLWYEPHNNSADNNKADLFFSAYDSEDGDGKCGGDGPPTCALDCPGLLNLGETLGENCNEAACEQLESDCDNNEGADNCWYQVDDCWDSLDSCWEFGFCTWISDTADNSDCFDDCDYDMTQEISEILSECAECTIDDCSTGGCEDDEVEDCSTGDCVPASALGDGWCDDENMEYGIDLSCYDEENADCDGNGCPAGYINDCSDTDCCPTAWIGDGAADCADQQYGCDLSCHDNDGGDCEDNSNDDSNNDLNDALSGGQDNTGDGLCDCCETSNSQDCNDSGCWWVATEVYPNGYCYTESEADIIIDSNANIDICEDLVNSNDCEQSASGCDWSGEMNSCYKFDTFDCSVYDDFELDDCGAPNDLNGLCHSNGFECVNIAQITCSQIFNEGDCNWASGNWAPQDFGGCTWDGDSCNSPDGFASSGDADECDGDLDCNGFCSSLEYVSDGYCDDGTYWIDNFNCEEFEFDGGDCASRGSNYYSYVMKEDNQRVLRKEYHYGSQNKGRSTADECDEQSYEWFWTQASAAGMEFTDENDDGIFQIGEPFTLMSSTVVYESDDLGDYVPTGMDQFGPCENCIPQYYTSDSDNLDVGEYGYEGMDLHAEFNAGIYIVTLKVTDVYGDIDYSSLLVIVNDERNEGPTVTDLRQQETYYISYGKDTRQTQIGGCEADNLSAADSDNDNLTFNWDYSYDAAGTSSPDGDGELAYEDGSDDSEYIHAFDALAQLGDSPDGWKEIGYDLEEGDHTFTFTATDPYGETASTSSTIKIRREPDAAHANVSVVHEDLKYITVEVSDNNLNEPIEDECYGKVYDGDLDNTRTIELFNDGGLIEVFRQDNDGNWIADSEDAGESTFIQIDKALEAETSYHYTVQSYNDDGEPGAFNDDASSAIGTTGNRPTITVLSPNGAEIRSISDLYDVDFATTDPQYISKIEVFYLRDGVTEEAGTDTDGNVILSDSGVNSGGEAQGDNTNNFEISDDTGVEINYDAKVLVRVYDVGNYDGNNVQSNDDTSDFPFTMAAHSISKEYGSGWHLIGTPLTPYNDELVDNLSGSFGQWGSNWVAYDVDGHYDNLDLNLGEGYYVALADSQILTQEGNPVIADPDCDDCDDNNFDLADINLDKGWNLISNPLVNKVSKETFTLSYDGQDLEFDDAVDAGWIAPTIYGWFENSYESIERIMPFGGYFVNTSRSLTLKIRPHLFDDGELTRKSEDLALVPTLKLRASDMSGNGNSDFVIIGLLEDANDEFVYGEDEYDLPNNAYSSMGGEYIDLRIGSDLMKDMKSFDYDEYQVWNVSIKTEKVDNDINLTWGDVSGFNDALHIVINGEAINMHEESSFELSAMIDEVAIVLGDVDAYLNPIPDNFGLGAAYPNPFNPTTNLSLALNQDGFVSMSVFNVRGQVVQTLVDRNMKAGYHNVAWNADGVSSGMYFVRVEMGDNMAIQKLMLLK